MYEEQESDGYCEKSRVFIQMIDMSQPFWGQASPSTCSPPAELNLWKGILLYIELLLHLSAKTVSKSLLLLLQWGHLSTCRWLNPVLFNPGCSDRKGG